MMRCKLGRGCTTSTPTWLFCALGKSGNVIRASSRMERLRSVAHRSGGCCSSSAQANASWLGRVGVHTLLLPPARAWARAAVESAVPSTASLSSAGSGGEIIARAGGEDEALRVERELSEATPLLVGRGLSRGGLCYRAPDKGDGGFCVGGRTKKEPLSGVEATPLLGRGLSRGLCYSAPDKKSDGGVVGGRTEREPLSGKGNGGIGGRTKKEPLSGAEDGGEVIGVGDVEGREDEDEQDEEEKEVVVVARKRTERKDSVTDVIMKEREAHLLRLATADFDKAMAKKFKALSLGTRKRARQAGGFSPAYNEDGKQVHSTMGAGGFARLLGSASKGWPRFKHRLPEVALAGHTNCGKSTLVNALSGIHPRKGPAPTSDRAGWTDLVGFYQVGKKPPVLTMVDLPGYGHAVATKRAVKGWVRMIKEYITTREELCRCCVLVDCTRGFCEEDRTLLRLLAKKGIPHQIVLTKADLLTPELLSACVLLLQRDLSDLVGRDTSATVSFSAVCGSSGAGVTALWKALAKIASESPGSLVATQAAHAAARLAREKEAKENEEAKVLRRQKDFR